MSVNPFDPKTVLLAKHAQHVVLIHFPIALFIVGVTFDLLAQWSKRRGLDDAAYYNLLVAAISTVPVVATGILAWQFALEGQKVKGILLLHMVTAAVSTVEPVRMTSGLRSMSSATAALNLSGPPKVERISKR